MQLFNHDFYELDYALSSKSRDSNLIQLSRKVLIIFLDISACQQNINNMSVSCAVTKKESAQNDLEEQINMNTVDMAKVLIIGETGSGKTTLINYLTNYFRGGTLDDIKVAVPTMHCPEVTETFGHSEKSIHDQSVSQTQLPRQYLFENTCRGDKQYLFVDTPGLADVNGLEQEKINMQNILDAVNDLGGLSIVIIVINVTSIRLTSNVQTVLSQLWGHFPSTIMEAVIVVLTHAKRYTSNYDFSKLHLHGNVYPIYMENSAFSSSSGSWSLDSKRKLQEDWNESLTEIQRMISIIGEFKVKSVDAFNVMIDRRNKIKHLLHEASVHSCQILEMQDQIQVCEGKVTECGAAQVKFKDFTKIIEEQRKTIPAEYHSTICSNCTYVCHDGCNLKETTKKGDQIFRCCWALYDRNACRSCPQSCDYTQHYYARVKVVVTKASRIETIQEIKSKYDQATKHKHAAMNEINTVTDTKKLLEGVLLQQIKEIKSEYENLRVICSNFDYSNELLITINQINAKLRTLHSTEAQQQAKRLIDSLTYIYRQFHEDYIATRTKSDMKIIDTYLPPRAVLPKNVDSSPEPPPRVPTTDKYRQPVRIIEICLYLNYFLFYFQKQYSSDADSDSDDFDDAAKRTIFVRNLPIYTPYEQIISVFLQFGPIEVSLYVFV